MGETSTLITKYLEKYPDGIFKERESMSAHTSFRIGGAASVMFFPRTDEELAYLLVSCRESGTRTLVMGNGTNLLVADRLPEMAVIKTTGLDAICERDHVITAGAGALLSRVASRALESGLSGLAFAAGIPGSAGGAVYMNAGAYGGEMKDVVKSVTALDKDLHAVRYSAEECGFSYRHSRFSDTELIILSVEIALRPGNKAEIKAEMDELARKRRAKQPLNLPSAGSTFKRPQNGFAAAMIEEAGLKGYTVGGAQVSEKHSGFVVNKGGATFSDVLTVMEYVREMVKARTGVELVPEVKIIR